MNRDKKNTIVEEEWENADLQFQQLDIKSSNSVMLPEHLQLDSSQDEGINFFNDDFETATSTAPENIPQYEPRYDVSNASGSFQLQYNNPIGAASNQTMETPIERALVDALRSDKERLNALRIEKDLYEFVCSGRPVYEMLYQTNSFRRLLTYKIAQRFMLEHRGAEYILDSGERGFMITIFRTTSTYIPRPLLIDASRSIPMETERTFVQSSAQPGVANPRVMVMKRSSQTPTERAGGVQRQVQTAEDKEKQYLAARARIFGEEEEADASQSETEAVSAPASSTVTIGTAAVTMEKSVSPDSISLRNDLDEAVKGKSSPPVLEGEEESEGGDVDTRRSGRGGSSGKRSVMRNKDAEKADPDFTRRHADARMYPQQQMYAPHPQYLVPPPNAYTGMGYGFPPPMPYPSPYDNSNLYYAAPPANPYYVGPGMPPGVYPSMGQGQGQGQYLAPGSMPPRPPQHQPQDRPPQNNSSDFPPLS